VSNQDGVEHQQAMDFARQPRMRAAYPEDINHMTHEERKALGKFLHDNNAWAHLMRRGDAWTLLIRPDVSPDPWHFPYLYYGGSEINLPLVTYSRDVPAPWVAWVEVSTAADDPQVNHIRRWKR
jgi:hypothetical protein